MKKYMIPLVVVLIGAAAFVWKVKGRSHRNQKEMTVLTVQTGPIERTVEATGEVDPLNRVEIKPPVQGRMENLLVDEGGRVKSGQILASNTVKDLVFGSGLEFQDRGEHELKGVPGRWQLYAVQT